MKKKKIFFFPYFFLSPSLSINFNSQERGDFDTLVERESGHRYPGYAERVPQQRPGHRRDSNSDNRGAVHLLFARISESSVQTV